MSVHLLKHRAPSKPPAVVAPASPSAVATTAATPTANSSRGPDGFDPGSKHPVVDVAYREACNARVRAGGPGPAFLPNGTALTGWHLLDGTAAATGTLDLAAGADVDIACLFALGAQRRGDRLVVDQLAGATPQRTFGTLRGAFAEVLPRELVREQLAALVDDATLRDFLATHPDPNARRDLSREGDLDQALSFWFWLQMNMRGLREPSHLRSLLSGDAGDSNAAWRSAVKACFVETLTDLLDRGQSATSLDSKLVERHLLGLSFGSPAQRLFDMVFARVRSVARDNTPALSFSDLAARMKAPSAQGARRILAEAALAQGAAATTTVTAAIVRRTHTTDPLVRDLLVELERSVAWRKRDTDTAIGDAFAAVLARTFREPLSLRDVHARYGDDGVDLVLHLLAGGDTQATVQFAGARTEHAPRFADEMGRLVGSLTPDPLQRLTALELLAQRRDELDPSCLFRTPFVVKPLTSAEQAALNTAPRLSLGRLASAHNAGAAAIDSLCALVRARDTTSLEQGRTWADFNAGKPEHFFAELERALDDKGGGTDATDEAVFRQALIEVFAPLADERGEISWHDVRKNFGGAAAGWFGVIAAAVDAGTFGPAPAERSLTHVPSGLSERALAAVGRSLPDVSFADRMPALDVVTKGFGGPHVLQGFEVVVAQHLFPTTMALVDALQKNGLPKDKLHLIGKSYSTHERTYAALLGEGIDVDHSSRQDHQIAEDAAVRLAGAARRQLQRLFASVTPNELADANARPRFLLFDEGGKLLETLHKEFPQYAKLCIGMEHTDRGMQLLDDLEKSGGRVLLPVLDMARSAAKKQFESPAIGESVVFHTELELHEAGAQPTKNEACVIGYGAVGKATADALRRRGYQVWVHDHDSAALARARADGCEVPAGDEAARRRSALAHAHLLVSCTGRTTIQPDEFADLLPDGAILTNAASGTHELGIHALGDDELARRTASERLRSDGQAMTTFQGRPLATGPYLAPGKHRHLVFATEVKGDSTQTTTTKQVLVLRGGAVVNMTRGMPPEVVQLTLGLVLTSILQAANSDHLPPGRVTLGSFEQTSLVDAVEADLRARGLPPLSAPDFRTVASWG
jgi:S-adenosylhomocysteine hydrolase